MPLSAVHAAKLWLLIAGVHLPNVPKGAFANTPGDFGQALRSVQGANTNSGNAPAGKGPCN